MVTPNQRAYLQRMLNEHRRNVRTAVAAMGTPWQKIIRLLLPTIVGVTQSSGGYVSTTTQMANPTSAFTLEIWLKNPTGNCGLFGLAAPQTSGSTTQTQIQISCTTTTINAALVNVSNVITNSQSTGLVLDDGQWHHICVTYDGTNLTTYVDGAQTKQTATSFRAQTNSWYHIGDAKGTTGWPLTGNDNYFTGSISRAALYTGVALSAVQVAAHFNTGLNVSFTTYDTQVVADGATAYWKLTETAGTNAADSVGSNTGTYQGTITLNQSSSIMTPVGSPAVAWTRPTFLLAQVQINQGNIPLSIGSISATTPSAGTSGGGSGGGTGGGGGGGGCFSPETPIRMAAGLCPISEIKPGDFTEDGIVAEVHVHDWDGFMQKMPFGLVTPKHSLLVNDRWVRADEVFEEAIPYKGKVYNLTIHTEEPMYLALSSRTQRVYRLADGTLAHNGPVNNK